MNEQIGNLSGLQNQINANGLDVLIATTPENFTYTTSVVSWSQRLTGRLAMAILPKQGDPAILVAEQERTYVLEQSWIQDVKPYVAMGSSPITSLSDLLNEMGLGAGRIGVEISSFQTGVYQELISALPEAELIDCGPIFKSLREVKTEAEVELLRSGAIATERALMATYTTIRPGDRERSIVGRLAGNMVQNGADLPGFLFLTTGANTGHAHPSPSEHLVQIGDLVKSDCGAYFSGYLSDIARTGVVGIPSSAQKVLYEQLYGVHRRTLESIGPGVPANEVFRVASQAYQEADIPFPFSFAGHGIGLSVHEGPILSAQDSTPLAPNMVFSVETRIRQPGWGYHIEDMLRITDSGIELWTDLMNTSTLMEL